MRKICFIIFISLFLTVRAQVEAASLGDKTNFYVDSSYVLAGQNQVSVTLRKIGQNAYFYVENNWWDGLSSFEQVQKFNDLIGLAKEFDENIYPTLRKAFGTEWRPGIDNDERITILIVPMKEGIGGYFNSADEYPKLNSPNSNEREMIYFNASNLSSKMAAGLISQEFQHLISFHQKDKLLGVSEDVWLNELRSEMAVTLCGYDKELAGSNLELRIKNFLDKPYDSLTEWKNLPHDYGVVNLFGQYLIDQYGTAILTESLKIPQVGIESLNIALKKLGYEKEFYQIFTDWTAAVYVNDCSLAPLDSSGHLTGRGSEFCYRTENLKNFKVTPLVNFIPFVGKTSFSVVNTTKDWAGNWYKFRGGHDVLKIEFSGPPEEKFQVPYIITDINGKNSLGFFSWDNSKKGIINVSDFGTKNNSLVIIPSVQEKKANFSDNDQIYQFSWTASTIESPEIINVPNSNSVPDGSLIRAKGDYKAYVVTGKYRRWIQSPEIFNMYGHLKWENIIEVSEEQALSYQESFLVREKDDFRVYKIETAPLDSSEHLTGQAKKRWLNITAQDFEAKGFKWEEIFIINQKERDYFPAGAPILN